MNSHPTLNTTRQRDNRLPAHVCTKHSDSGAAGETLHLTGGGGWADTEQNSAVDMNRRACVRVSEINPSNT